MKVLLTGAFGNIGRNTLEELLKQGHKVRCFDIDTPTNRKAAQKYDACVRWGNIKNYSDVQKACDQPIIVLSRTFSSWSALNCQTFLGLPDLSAESNV